MALVNVVDMEVVGKPVVVVGTLRVVDVGLVVDKSTLVELEVMGERCEVMEVVGDNVEVVVEIVVEGLEVVVGGRQALGRAAHSFCLLQEEVLMFHLNLPGQGT